MDQNAVLLARLDVLERRIGDLEQQNKVLTEQNKVLMQQKETALGMAERAVLAACDVMNSTYQVSGWQVKQQQLNALKNEITAFRLSQELGSDDRPGATQDGVDSHEMHGPLKPPHDFSDRLHVGDESRCRGADSLGLPGDSLDAEARLMRDPDASAFRNSLLKLYMTIGLTGI